ncbi:MAG: shikimate dehydrogenase [Promethearchaeia archaeon]
MSKRNFVTARTKILCVIGHPIEHSMSPIMHNAAIQDLGLDYLYIAFDVAPNKLKEAIKGLKTLNIKGINVTLPHKENAIKFIDKVDELAQKIGAINTIKNEGGFLIGRNTDVEGANKALIDAGCETAGKNIVVIGAGGATKAVLYSLASDTNKITIINRSEDRAKILVSEMNSKIDINIESKRYSEIILKEEISNADILINATPVGMFPTIDISPVSKKILHSDLFVFDLIYNPLETQLIKDSKEIGCQTLSGLDMLVNQGALAFEWWTNRKPNLELMKLKIIKYLGMK